MFAVIQTVICILYFFVFLSEAVTKNGPAPCFLKQTHARIRVNRAITEPIITKSLNSQDSQKVGNLAEKESLILIKSLDSENTKKENKPSVNEESQKESQKSVIDSVLSISNPEYFQTEKNKEENESPKSNLTDSAQIIIEALNLEETKNKEKNLKDNKSPNATSKDYSQTMESLYSEITKNKEGNSTEKESLIASSSESTKNEEEKSIVKEAVFFNKSLDSEKRKEEGNFTENDSLNKNIKNSVQIVKKPLNLEQIKEANSTGKESVNENLTESSPILTKALNSENTKIEKGNVTEKKSNLKIRSVSLQKSITEGKKSKMRRETNGSNLSEKAKNKVDRVFIRAYENCKLLRDNHFLRVAGSNLKETRNCVVKELRKSEKYPGEFVKYLDNKEIIRRA